MTIGLLQIELNIHNSHSLKEKRMVLKSLKDRLRRQFNISIAETDAQDKWQYASLGIVTISTDSRHANQVLSRTVEFIEAIRGMDIIKYRVEML